MVSVAACGQDRQAVGLELVLLVDVSASVNDAEFRLQTAGLASAFANPAVLAAIRSLAPRGMAVSVVQWADQAHQQRSVDWTVLLRDSDAVRFAGQVATMPRHSRGDHTAIGDALAFGLNELRSNTYVGLRRVIDVSGDGRNNGGRRLGAIRDEVFKHGVTINGLAILNEIPQLGQYFRNRLIGGENAFVLTARDYTDFARAMRNKLEREIGSVPLTHNASPDTAPGATIETHARQAPRMACCSAQNGVM